MDQIKEVMRILREYGYRATGEEPEELAEAWLSKGFTSWHVQRWLNVNVFDPEPAARLWEMGVAPEEITPETGYLYADGKISLDHVLEDLADLRFAEEDNGGEA